MGNDSLMRRNLVELKLIFINYVIFRHPHVLTSSFTCWLTLQTSPSVDSLSLIYFGCPSTLLLV